MRISWISAALAVLAGACGGDPTTPQRPAWDRGLPDASVMGGRRGLTPARGIVHLHSPYSHDACDGEPRAPGTRAPNEACLADLRAALCATRVDYAALTDHDDSMADEDFPSLFNMRGADQPVMNAQSEPIASRMVCDDGHQVLFTVGSENTLMPVMLDRHVPGTLDERHAIYNGDDAATSTAFRAAGGLVWIAHTEQHELPELRTVAPDGLEIYNLHANLDPDIRRDYLGLSEAGAIQAVANFADTNPGGPEPDLALLGFLAANQPALDRWNTLLGEGTRIVGTAGTDAHQNALPILLADGERGDSYRRMIRWFGNIVLVADPDDPVMIEEALRAGRAFVAFELLGTPEGFDARAVAPSGGTAELGGQLFATDNAVFTVDIPTVHALAATLPAPAITARILRIDATGVHELATGTEGVLVAPMDAPGAYRVEISMIPHHLGPYLGDLGTEFAEVSLPWIYGNPIYVE